VIGDMAEFPSFEQESEMSNSTVCGKKFTVKVEYCAWVGVSFCEKNAGGRQAQFSSC
jgi:hypothetical protein